MSDTFHRVACVVEFQVRARTHAKAQKRLSEILARQGFESTPHDTVCGPCTAKPSTPRDSDRSAVLETVRQAGASGIQLTKLATKVGRSITTVRNHVWALMCAGLVRSTPSRIYAEAYREGT